jgi:protease I
MATRIDGKLVAFLATDGVELVELDQPWAAIREAGGDAELVSLQAGSLQGFNHIDKGDKRPVDTTVKEARVEDYDALVLPGGVVNSDFIRADSDAVSFVRRFFEQGKPVAVICHGSWVLAEADVLRGRTLTSWPSLRTDLRNAGATWVDRDVVTDQGLVSSRMPADLKAFCAKLIEEIAEGEHKGQRRSVARAK